MNWDYIGGFFDGEGSVIRNRKGFRVNITQTNYAVLQDIKSYSKVGIIVKITKRKAHWKDSWLYFIARQGDVYCFLKNIKSRTIVKRGLIKSVLPRLESYLRQVEARRIKLRKRIAASLKLREVGLSYRQIGKKLKIDHGYIRRLVLSNS